MIFIYIIIFSQMKLQKRRWWVRGGRDKKTRGGGEKEDKEWGG